MGRTTKISPKTYRPWVIEPKWQKIWEKKGIYKTPEKGKKLYCLDMFPYPSGAGLHVGHTRIYTASDVMSRYFRAKGYQVLHPMGWDAFGLPAENDAIARGINPKKLVPKNIANFRRQMKMMGFSYDWDREINTSSPDYYRWTQWLFLKLYEMGLIYRATVPINWCPFCKTGLANEEVLPGGIHERCDKTVTKKDMKQWLFKITDYADELLADLKGLDWPEGILEMQRNWIGRTEGVEIRYPVVDTNFFVVCYTTRPDTNFGATFVVIAPEHPILKQLKIENLKLKIELEKYIKQSQTKSELERTELAKEKTGVFTGFYALNRLTGRQMPIWVADFVVLTAGTGIVVGVPAHDERDWQFGRRYGLEMIPVLKPAKGKWDYEKGAYTDIDNAIVFNSDFLNGLTAKEAIKKITDYLVKKKWGRRAVNYHLRDWVFSRQRYWGEPIPLVYCQKCGDKNGVVPVPYKELPVKLPYVKKYQPTGTGESPLAKIKDWVNVACPECGGVARRETDTMPNWAGSCWYFLRFPSTRSAVRLSSPSKSRPGQMPFDPKITNYWLPVDWYLGGAEHAVLHLLYSRFWVKAFQKIGLVNFSEPFLRLRNVGMVLAEDGRKMSKSLGNVINPDEVVAKFGADTLRGYEMFMAPFSQAVNWSPRGVLGVYRFLNRIWRVYWHKGKITKKTSPELVGPLHRLIKKVGEDIEATKYNTAIAAMMEVVNFWSREGETLSKTDAGIFLRLLAPFAPHLAEELWQQIGANRVHQQSWPRYDEKLIKEEEVTIVVQVNGKVRGQIEIKHLASSVQPSVEELAKKEKNVAKYLKGKKIKKVVFVPGKLINFVV